MGKIDTHGQSEPKQAPLSGGKRTVLLDLEEFRARLAEFAHDSGSMAELARRLDVSGQFLGRLISGKQRPGKKVLEPLGARRRVMIEIDLEAL